MYDSRIGALAGAAFVRFVWQELAALLPVRPADFRRGRPCVGVVDTDAVQYGQTDCDAKPLLQAAVVTFC